jgi:hypothetical protein
MSDIKLTDDLKQMNAYWRLLAGLVNEGLGVIGDARLSPEARLEQLREKLQFARRYLRVLPPSVKAELDADPRVQAVLADIARRSDHPHPEGDTSYLVLGDDGEFHEMVIGPEEGLRPLSDAELRALFPEDGETA